jgi:hypothetical protein
MGLCSYPANAQVFRERTAIPGGIQDGATNTIAFAEHYSACQYLFHYWVVDLFSTQTFGVHRATFADRWSYPFPNYEIVKGVDDVYPVTTGGLPPVSTGSVPDKSFQIAPTLESCDGSIAQTPHKSGMLIALADGFVRTIGPSIQGNLYWALVTPSGGELAGDDW